MAGNGTEKHNTCNGALVVGNLRMCIDGGSDKCEEQSSSKTYGGLHCWSNLQGSRCSRICGAATRWHRSCASVVALEQCSLGGAYSIGSVMSGLSAIRKFRPVSPWTAARSDEVSRA